MADEVTNSTRAFDTQFDLLKMELDLVNKAIGQQDEITKSIKNWAIVTWTASIGLAVSQSQLHPYLWLTAVIPFLFWFVDASFRRIQRSFIVRVKDISDHVNSQSFRNAAETGEATDFPLLEMRNRTEYSISDWDNWRKTHLLGVMTFRSVSFLYGGLIIVSVVMWLVLRVAPAAAETTKTAV
ncbi:MAG: hypothetical protein AAFX93_02260 [Verrucomicrobiota bacterium]